MSFSRFFRRAHPETTVATAQSDTVDVNIKLLYVEAAGDLALQLEGDTAATVITVIANTWISLPIKRIWSTGTTIADADLNGYA